MGSKRAGKVASLDANRRGREAASARSSSTGKALYGIMLNSRLSRGSGSEMAPILITGATLASFTTGGEEAMTRRLIRTDGAKSSSGQAIAAYHESHAGQSGARWSA